MPIKISINVNKIEKQRLYEGAKGKYLKVIAIETPNSEHGDYMVVQEVTKEEREAGTKGPILGNGKNLGGGNRGRQGQSNRPANPRTSSSLDDEEIPF